MQEFVKNCLIYLIKFYRNILSPLKLQTCRYYPSCSLYAIQAIEKYGTIKGLLKAMSRLLRCHPFSKGGYDQV